MGFREAEVRVVLVETIGPVGQEVGAGVRAQADRPLEEIDRPRRVLLPERLQAPVVGVEPLLRNSRRGEEREGEGEREAPLQGWSFSRGPTKIEWRRRLMGSSLPPAR